MLVFPVIDIKDGKCVRTILGHNDKTLYYSESPVQVAKLFRKENFKAIHITDLDGAMYGDMRNFNLIREISESVDIPIQLGGGIRNFDNVQRVIEEMKVYRIVIGTAALSNNELIEKVLEKYSSTKLAVCIDERENGIAKDGWRNRINVTPVAFAKRMEDLGVRRIIYQDVTRVGNLCGPNIERIKELAEETNLKITAAGGICSYEDLKKISMLEPLGIDSVMISRALYENQFPCQRIWREAECEDISLELPEMK
jgi:phosphoribosylformimino-5-aminoimidazole carboxamide ribotide isomerase